MSDTGPAACTRSGATAVAPLSTSTDKEAYQRAGTNCFAQLQKDSMSEAGIGERPRIVGAEVAGAVSDRQLASAGQSNAACLWSILLEVQQNGYEDLQTSLLSHRDPEAFRGC